MLSIVMPAYNEEDIIRESVREWYETVILKIPDSELIVVDDAGKDQTGVVLSTLAETWTQLKVVRSPVNRGHGPSVYDGLRRAKGEFVFQTDSDRQHVPAEFWNLWELRGENDFVMGVRARREDGLFRKFITRSLRLVNFLFWGVYIRDANCPFKLMRREPLNQVLDWIPPRSFIPMLAVSILSRKLRFRVADVSVTHLPRTGGTQSLKGMAKWVKVAYRCTRELLGLRWRWATGRKPSGI